MNLQQAETAGLIQLTEWCDPRESMEFISTHWLTKETRYHEVANLAWLHSEKNRITSDPSRVAFVVANENAMAYALFVNCVIAGCREKEHSHSLK